MKGKIIYATYRIITIVMFPFYLGAYIIAHALRMKCREDMPTIREWFIIDEEW